MATLVAVVLATTLLVAVVTSVVMRGYLNRQLDEHYFYAIGYHLCVLLDRLDRSWRSRVHSRENFLFDVVHEIAESPK